MALDPFDEGTLQSLLSTHKHTLKVLQIDQPFGNGLWGLINARDFPNLEFLSLAREPMSTGLETPITDADMLLGPSLKTFEWGFGSQSFLEPWLPFGEREEHWLRGLASAAIARETLLKTISIIFGAEFCPSGSDDTAYPWDRMDRVHDEIKQHGLAVVYKEPPVNRKEWENSRKRGDRSAFAT